MFINTSLLNLYIKIWYFNYAFLHGLLCSDVRKVHFINRVFGKVGVKLNARLASIALDHPHGQSWHLKLNGREFFTFGFLENKTINDYGKFFLRYVLKYVVQC